MKSYELASQDLYQFEESLKKAKDLAMEVEWFAAFMETVYYQSYESAKVDRDLSIIIEKANKKLGL